MYVCEKCHDMDRNAIKCPYSYAQHRRAIGTYVGLCDICGKYRDITNCSAYVDTKIKAMALKCPTCVYQFTCSKLKRLGPDHGKVKLCSMYREKTNGSLLRPHHSLTFRGVS